LGLTAYGQDRDRRERVGDGRADQRIEHPNGIVQDWSHRHVLYPRVGPIRNLIAVQNDPRALHSWQEAWRREWRRGRYTRRGRGQQVTLHPDWSISLGIGTTAPAMFPAKYTFDSSATPDCTGDFVAYAVNVAGGAGQPNIVGFNNLYSGTVGGVGICNAPANGRTGGVNDDGVSATTLFSYNVTAGGGIVSTSPSLSLDGNKIAFVETGSGAAHFHVLAWKSGDGVATNLQTVTSPVQITGGFNPTAPTAGSGTATDLVLGTVGDTLSSPFIDYTQDLAYVGSDDGTLYRIANVFCTGVSTSCTPGTSAAPALDVTWGLGTGKISTGCGGALTGAVVDGGTGNIFVGCSDGTLYGFTPAGLALSNSPLTVGNGGATGGIVDTPMIDAVNEFVYVAAGASVGGTQVVVQASTIDLSSPQVATLSPGGNHNLHGPVFNDSYFSGVGTPLLYEVAGDSGTLGIKLYGIGFSGHTMNTGTPTNVDPFAVGGAYEISPLTEFVSGGEDRFFESFLNASSGNLASFRIDTGFPAGLESSASAGSGTTGIVVDNAATGTNQADSVYFGALGANTAVKLTQSALQ
jgi:hypothetical protein